MKFRVELERTKGRKSMYNFECYVGGTPDPGVVWYVAEREMRLFTGDATIKAVTVSVAPEKSCYVYNTTQVRAVNGEIWTLGDTSCGAQDLLYVGAYQDGDELGAACACKANGGAK